jgi:hypothetical protein
MEETLTKSKAKIIKKRVDFYAKICKNDDVKMETFEALNHNKTKATVYLHLKYQLLEKGKATTYEEIETFTDDAGWVCLFNQNNLENLNNFLSDTTKADIDCKNVKLKP